MSGLTLPTGYVAESGDVFYATDAVTTIGTDDIAFLKQAASGSKNRRARLCLHDSPESVHQQMLIAVHRDSYLRPHYHVGKTETYHVVEGSALIVFFTDDGSPETFVEIGAVSAPTNVSYRVQPLVTHTFLIRSEWVVYWEVTQGPFDTSKTKFPDWSPAADDIAGVERLRRAIETRAAATGLYPPE